MSNSKKQIGTEDELKQNSLDDKVPNENVPQTNYNQQQFSSTNPFETQQTLEHNDDHHVEIPNNNELDLESHASNSLNEIDLNDQEEQVDDSSQQHVSTNIQVPNTQHTLNTASDPVSNNSGNPSNQDASVASAPQAAGQDGQIIPAYRTEMSIQPNPNIRLQHVNVYYTHNTPHPYINHNIIQTIIVSPLTRQYHPPPSFFQNPTSEKLSQENAQVQSREQNEKAQEIASSSGHNSIKNFKCPCTPCSEEYLYEGSLRHHMRKCHMPYLHENYPFDYLDDEENNRNIYKFEWSLSGKPEDDATEYEEDYDEDEEDEEVNFKVEPQEEGEDREQKVQDQQNNQIQERLPLIKEEEEVEENQQKIEKDVNDEINIKQEKEYDEDGYDDDDYSNYDDYSDNEDNVCDNSDDEDYDPNEIQFEKKKPKKKKISTLPKSQKRKTKKGKK